MTQAAVQEISLQTVWQLARPASLSVTVVACALGLACAAGCGYPLDWAAALATLLLACGFHAGVNILHTYLLAMRGADGQATAESGPFGAGTGLGLIAHGAIGLAEVRQVTWALLGLLLVAGLTLAIKAGGGLVLLGLAGVLLAWTSAAPPLRLHKRGGAPVSAALAWWLVVQGADYVQRHQFFLIAQVDALSFALLVAALALAQQAKPASIAAKPGRGLGNHGFAVLYSGLILLAYSWLAGGVGLLYHPHQALWGMVSLPVSLAAAGLLWRSAQQPQRALLAWRLSVAAVLLHGLSMAGGLITVAMV